MVFAVDPMKIIQINCMHGTAIDFAVIIKQFLPYRQVSLSSASAPSYHPPHGDQIYFKQIFRANRIKPKLF
jgi:hypothetical protein